MRLLIHGGYFKTGTTAFQRWLHASRDALSEMGIYVPDPGPNDNHGYALNVAIRTRDTDAAIWHELDAAADQGHAFAILSAETIASYSAEDFAGFFARVQQHDPQLFLVLRHWQDYLPSKYAQDTRRGGWLTLPQFVSRLDHDFDRHPDANFGLPFHRAYEAGFRASMAVGYRADVALDIVAELTGVTKRQLDGGRWPAMRVNQRPDLLLIERIRLGNAIVGAREELRPDHVYDGAIDERHTPRFLLLTDVVRLLCERHPELVAEIDAALEAQLVGDWVGDGGARFDCWRGSLRETLERCGVEDRLGPFDPPSRTDSRASRAGPEHLSASVVEEIFARVIEIRSEVWRKRKKLRSQTEGNPRVRSA